MPPETIPPEAANGILDRLPPDVVGYVVLGLIVWWMTRAAYREVSKDRGALLDRLEARLDQTERSLAAVTQDLDESRRSERASHDRLDAMEAKYERRSAEIEEKYEKRIAELEHEVALLRGEVSEPIEISP